MNALAEVKPRHLEASGHEAAPYWGAHLRLSVACAQQRSFLADVRHEGPLRVQRPFYPEGRDLCHLYLLHPPGGLVSGDHLRIGAQIEAGAKALITTPSAGKIYRANDRGIAQTQQTRLVLGEGASLEWLPQESILFNRAAAALETEIHIHPGARLVAWELVCLGRPHSEERFESGSLRQRFSVWSQGVPLYLDHFTLRGDDEAIHAAYGLQGLCCLGTMVIGCSDMAVPAVNRLVERLRDILPYGNSLRAGITRLRTLIVIRLLGSDTEKAKQVLMDAWQLIRPGVLGRDASIPRIWHT